MFEGKRLKEQRQLLKLSQADLADEINVHENTIRRWEKNGGVPNAKKLELLAEVLGTTVAYLSGESNEVIFNKNNENSLNAEVGSSAIKNPSFIKEGNIIGNKNVLVYESGGQRFIFPATEKNQSWFREVMGNAIARRN